MRDEVDALTPAAECAFALAEFDLAAPSIDGHRYENSLGAVVVWMHDRPRGWVTLRGLSEAVDDVIAQLRQAEEGAA
jgi:hypothetical protein